MAHRRQYLEWHGQQWRVVVKVPAKLRPIIGKTKLKMPLKTADLKVADEMKGAIVTRFKAELRAAERALASNAPHMAEALRFRAAHSEYDDASRDRIHQRADEIETTTGPRAAADFAEIARGLSTPLDHHADAFIAYKATYRLKTQGDFRRVLGWLRDWRPQAPFIEYIDRKAAGRFIEQSLCVGRSRKKAGAYLAFLREYWEWMTMRHHVEENPWLGQRLPADPRPDRTAEHDTGKRPYTDAEVARLVHGHVADLMRPPPSLYLGDLIHIAALSGMRLEEICQLRVADCAAGSFAVHEGKTANARRTVPIHPSLAAIVARRTEGRPADAYLIDGLPPPPPSRDSRSDPAAKAFTRYRRKVGVDERPNGKAKSNVDFHSFRRWFIRKAVEALEAGHQGFTAWTLADVVGHDDEGMKDTLRLTMRQYPGPSGDTAKRALVEAVMLPSAPPPTPKGETPA